MVIAVLSAVPGSADDSPAGDDAEAERNQKLLAAYKQQAKAYEFTLPDRNVTLRLREQPVFQWVNRARVGTPRVQQGGVYVWTHQGRAEVLGTIFSQTVAGSNPSVYHEFHSLATGPLRATRGGLTHWDRAEPGIELKPFPETSPPSQNQRLRAAQMRTLARRFSGYSINYDNKRWELSLLPEPLYRMETPTEDLLASAVFALVSTAGTDPEVLLVLEARRTDTASQWQYAVCRFTDLKTWIALDGEPVWSFENGTNGPTVDAGPADRYRFSYEASISLPE